MARSPRNGAKNLDKLKDEPVECRLVFGDNLEALGALKPASAGHFTLAYLDPPFFTGKQHQRIRRGRDPEGQIVRQARPAFDDRWLDLQDYLGTLRERVQACWELLASHGSLVIHVDPKTSHYCKVMCDELFGAECFASEIIWRYRRWPSKTPNFQRVHDVLLRYVRDPSTPPRFCQLYEPLAPSTRATWGTNKQRAVVAKDGRRERSSTTDEPSPGVPLGDVWEIGILAPVSKERTGYPTQKPESLLQRLIASLTAPGDAVLDPYAGSGTTLSVAHRLGRPSLGIDSSPEALDVALERLRSAGVSPVVERVSPRGPGLVAASTKRLTGQRSSAA